MTNMKFYLTIPQVKDYFFRDLEAPKFHVSSFFNIQRAAEKLIVIVYYLKLG